MNKKCCFCDIFDGADEGIVFLIMVEMIVNTFAVWTMDEST